MPYNTVNDLPPSVRDHLPPHAQEIFVAAFNSAYQQYADPDKRRTDEGREEVAFKVAWSAVGSEYQKDEKTGRWKKKPA
jgi:cation transport regulator